MKRRKPKIERFGVEIDLNSLSIKTSTEFEMVSDEKALIEKLRLFLFEQILLVADVRQVSREDYVVVYKKSNSHSSFIKSVLSYSSKMDWKKHNEAYYFNFLGYQAGFFYQKPNYIYTVYLLNSDYSKKFDPMESLYLKKISSGDSINLSSVIQRISIEITASVARMLPVVEKEILLR